MQAYVNASGGAAHKPGVLPTGRCNRIGSTGRPAAPEHRRGADRPDETAAYLMAIGLIGEPVPPVITRGGPENMNS